MTEQPKPWERQPGEPMRWYDRFDRFYRAQGPDRNIKKAYHLWREHKGRPAKPRTGTSSSWIDNHEKWDWKKRAEAWDMEERQLRIIAEEEKRAEMLQEHITLARALWQRGAATLQQMREEDTILTHEQARQYIKDGINLERQARGMPEYLLEIAQLSDEELLERYAELLAQTSSSGSGDETAGANTADKDD